MCYILQILEGVGGVGVERAGETALCRLAFKKCSLPRVVWVGSCDSFLRISSDLSLDGFDVTPSDLCGLSPRFQLPTPATCAGTHILDQARGYRLSMPVDGSLGYYNNVQPGSSGSCLRQLRQTLHPENIIHTKTFKD